MAAARHSACGSTGSVASMAPSSPRAKPAAAADPYARLPSGAGRHPGDGISLRRRARGLSDAVVAPDAPGAERFDAKAAVRSGACGASARLRGGAERAAQCAGAARMRCAFGQM